MPKKLLSHSFLANCVYCGYFRRLVFGNSLTFSYILLCFYVKPPNFPGLFDPRGMENLRFAQNDIVQI